MRHTLDTVARNRFFDTAEFVPFALEREAKFGIIGSDGNAHVSTWHVNELVDAFREHLGDVFLAHRQRQIEIQREEREAAAAFRP